MDWSLPKTKDLKKKYFDYTIINGHEAVVNKHSTKEELQLESSVYYFL